MKFLKAFLCFVLAIALGAPIVAHAKYKVYHQRSSGLYRGSLRNLNNKKVHYVRFLESISMFPTRLKFTRLSRSGASG